MTQDSVPGELITKSLSLCLPRQENISSEHIKTHIKDLSKSRSSQMNTFIHFV